MFFTFVCILITLVDITDQEYIQDEVINIISGFLDLQARPSHVNAFVCWKRSEIRLFYKLFAKNHKIRIVQNVSKYLEYPTVAEHQINLIDVECDDSYSVLEKATYALFLKQPFRWFVIGNVSKVIENNVDALVDSAFYVLEKKNSKIYEINALYKCSENCTTFFRQNITSWTSDHGFEYYKPINIYRDRKDLNGIPFTVSTYITPERNPHMFDYRFSHIDAPFRFAYTMIHSLLPMFNVSEILVYQPTYPRKLPNSTLFAGVVGDFQAKKIIVDAGSMFPFIDRMHIVDYLIQSAPTSVEFIFKDPPLSYVSNIFTHPFDRYVWISSFALFGITTIVSYSIVLWEWREPHYTEILNESLDSLRASPLEVGVLGVGAVTQQGSASEFKSYAGRVSMIFTLVSFMFLYTAYSANIVALLQSTAGNIKSLEDLVNSNIEFGMEDMPYMQQYLKLANKPIEKEIMKRIMSSKSNVMSLEEGMHRVQHNFFAFYTEPNKGYKVVSETFQDAEKCNLRKMDFLNAREPFIGVQKNTSYKELFKVGLFRLKESGIYAVEGRRLYANKPVCENKGSNFLSVGLIDIHYGFLYFGAGVTGALMIFLLEILWKWYSARRQNKMY